MNEPPNRIGLITDGLGRWALATNEESDVAVHYVRANEIAHLRAEVERLRAAMEIAKTSLADIGVDDALVAIDAALGDTHE